MPAMQSAITSHESELGAWTLVSREPPPALRPYVLRYTGYREEIRRFDWHLQPPFIGIPLIVNLGASYRISSPNSAEQRIDSFVGGLYDGPALVSSEGPQHSLQVDLTPLGARRIFGVPMHELGNRVVALDDLLGSRSQVLSEELHGQPGWDDRFAILDAVLLDRLSRAPEIPQSIAFAWDWLERSQGKANISGLASELGWSHRYLIAQFREHIGLPPKKLARILRFERALRAIHREETVCLASLAQAAGYFDQAHLHRDFREFTGRTPAELVNRRLPEMDGLIGD